MPVKLPVCRFHCSSRSQALLFLPAAASGLQSHSQSETSSACLYRPTRPIFPANTLRMSLHAYLPIVIRGVRRLYDKIWVAVHSHARRPALSARCCSTLCGSVRAKTAVASSGAVRFTSPNINTPISHLRGRNHGMPGNSSHQGIHDTFISTACSPESS